MNRLFLCASALALTTMIAHAEEPVVKSGGYVFGGTSALLSQGASKAISDSGLVAGIGMAGHESMRNVGVPSWEASYFRTAGKGTTLSATGISYLERAHNRPGSRGYYGFGLGVYNLQLDVPGTTDVAEASSRATSPTALPSRNVSGVRVAPTFLVGLPLGSKAFLEARYTGLGSLRGVRADQYSAMLGLRF